LPTERIYANYTDGQVYYTAGSIAGPAAERISSLRVFILGLPTKWVSYGLRVVLALLPMMLLLPVIVSFLRKQESRTINGFRVRHGMTALAIWQRCLCVLLAYMMLISPSMLDELAQAEMQYTTLGVSVWGQDNRTITYGYDANGSMTSKITKVTSTQAEVERVIYEYDLRNRQNKVKTSTDGGQTWSITAYKYDPDGNRVEKNTNGSITKYIVDAYNHTGYSQVFKETTGAIGKVYMTGLDVIGQAAYPPASINRRYMLYDGHGSVRQLTGNTGTLLSGQEYDYDAYGVMTTGPPAADKPRKDNAVW
jgi:YD repeat-containing protein